MDAIQRIEALEARLRALTPEDRSVGWVEDFASFCVGLLEEVRASLINQTTMPQWVLDRDLTMYFENPGILSGSLRDDLESFIWGLAD